MITQRKLLEQLQDITSPDRVITREKIPSKYRFDALRPYRAYPKLRRSGYVPWFLVRPRSVEEVSGLVRLARRFRIPVVAYGGGTGLMGAAVALRGGIMIDSSGLNRIEAISKDDMLIRVQSGVILEDLYDQADKRDLLFAHDPWTLPIATIGGAVSTNSLGYLGAKYGSIGDQLLALEAVLPDGSFLNTRPAQFSSTGFDLKRLFVGTEGTFGIVTSATVRAFPKPEKFALAAYAFPSFEQGYLAIKEMWASGVTAAMVDYGEEDPDLGKHGTSELNLAFDGLEMEVEAHLSRTHQIATKFGARRLDDRRAREFWDHRHDIALMYKRRISNLARREEPRTKFDYIHVSLPASKSQHFRNETLQLAKKGDVKVLEVGLWQGPELFSIVLSSTASNPKKASAKLWRTSNAIIHYAQDLGGSMEFCHGVGLKLAHLMEREHGLGLEVMRKLKRAVDHLGIMNPGKTAL